MAPAGAPASASASAASNRSCQSRAWQAERGGRGMSEQRWRLRVTGKDRIMRGFVQSLHALPFLGGAGAGKQFGFGRQPARNKRHIFLLSCGRLVRLRSGSSAATCDLSGFFSNPAVRSRREGCVDISVDTPPAYAFSSDGGCSYLNPGRAFSARPTDARRLRPRGCATRGKDREHHGLF